ncbi:MAG: Asp/Glu racemase, partial [Paraburkholderia fungorum]|nr:Asp/Glu racemase [Paraburkholderia fungorum]
APVIEGVTAALKWTEALVALRLSTAKRGDYARPLAKRYDGALEAFSPADVDPNPQPRRDSGARVAESANAAGLLRVNTTESPVEAALHIHPV